MTDNIEFDDDEFETPSRVSDWLLPVATAILALLVGMGAGALGMWWVATNNPELELVPRELTAEELEAACSPFVATAATQLEEAQEKVTVLKAQVTEKTQMVASLEAEMKKRSARGRELIRELEAAKAELKTVKAKLEVAEAEKAALSQQLKLTVDQLEDAEVALVKQKSATERHRSDALANKWNSFVNDAQLNVCVRGFKRGMDKCRVSVKSAMTPDLKDRYLHCIRAGQEAPTLTEVEKSKDPLPPMSQWLNEDDKRVKGWYVKLCDPTLPELDSVDDLPGLREPVQSFDDEEFPDLDDLSDLPEE